MFTIPEIFETLLEPFCQLFSARVWHHAQVLLVGAILSPAQRTVAAAMRVMGLSESRHFINYHRVLSRAVWSSRKASQILLVQLIAVFATSGVIVLGRLRHNRATSRETDCGRRHLSRPGTQSATGTL